MSGELEKQLEIEELAKQFFEQENPNPDLNWDAAVGKIVSGASVGGSVSDELKRKNTGPKPHKFSETGQKGKTVSLHIPCLERNLIPISAIYAGSLSLFASRTLSFAVPAMALLFND